MYDTYVTKKSNGCITHINTGKILILLYVTKLQEQFFFFFLFGTFLHKHRAYNRI